MNPTEKKCLVGSAVLHGGLLAGVLIFTAFGGRGPEPEPVNTITVFDLKNIQVTDGPTRGGGNAATPLPPAPKPAQPQQAQVAPAPPPPPPPPARTVRNDPPAPAPEPVKPVKVAKTDVNDISPDGTLPSDKKSDKGKPKINTTLVTRSKPNSRSTTDSEADTAHDSRVATARDQLAKSLKSSLSKVGAGLSGGVKMDSGGFGGDGPAMVNYNQLVISLFDNAWNPPPQIGADNAIAEVRITIHRTGKVNLARISKRSGIPEMDKSVQRALDSVQSVPPFPAEAKDFERVFVIQFDLKAKRNLG